MMSRYQRYLAVAIELPLLIVSVGSVHAQSALSNENGTSQNEPPVASFVAVPDSGAAPLLVSFDGSDSSDSDGSIASYGWDFDGDTVVDTTIADTSVVDFTYTTPGLYSATLTVTDDEGATDSTSLVITATDSAAQVLAFVESDGEVVFESESFDGHISRGGKNWISNDLAGSVGASMRPEPDDTTNIDTSYAFTSPELRYRVQFNTAGTYYVWARALAADGDSDSWHVGIDGQEVASADRMSIGSQFNQWRWINRTMDPEGATFDIASPGIYTVNVWMREDGVYLDRMLLTTDPDFVPSGDGPAESQRTEVVGTATEPDDKVAGGIPGRFELQGNYPNPFNPVTTIQYALPQVEHVRLDVFDMLGRRVARLIDETQLPGIHRAVFDAGGLVSGVYLYRLEAGAFNQTSQMILVK